MEELVYNVVKENSGERIDKFICHEMQDKSRSYIQGLIENEEVLVNGKNIKSNYKVKENDIITLNIHKPKELNIIPQNIPIDILYEDSDVVVINKPKGMVVHPAPGNYENTLVNALLYHCTDLSSINGIIRPGIVHRIDKDTTGILVVAKNDESHNFLSKQLKDHSMTREYYALVEGRIKDEEGIIDKPIGRNKKDRLKMGIVPDGKRAVTHYKVLEVYKSSTLVKCVLETGRTHQIRVHMASIGHPLVGDTVYGFKKQKYKVQGQMLHARTLGFIHPRTKKYMEFSKELPEEFKNLLNKIRSEG